MMTTICDGLAMNAETRRVFVGQRIINLSELEYRLLAVLAKDPGWVVSVEVLGATLWGATEGWQVAAAPTMLKQVVYRLRKRIGRKWIESIRGRGYRLGVD